MHVSLCSLEVVYAHGLWSEQTNFEMSWKNNQELHAFIYGHGLCQV